MELKQLYKECLKNSITAQKYLFDILKNQMFLQCRRYVKSNEQAEEVLMNGFLKVFTHLPSINYNSNAAFVGWINKIMVNECLQFLRSKENYLQIVTNEIPEMNIISSIESDLATDELYLLVLQLPIGYRIVFNLYEVEGYTHKEIAALLNITEGTSKSQLSKAKQYLQKLLIDKDGGMYARK